MIFPKSIYERYRKYPSFFIERYVIMNLKWNWTNHSLIRDKNDQSHEELTTHIIYECNGKEVVIMMVMVEWGRRGHYNYSNGWFNSFFFCSFVQYETYIGVIATRRLISIRNWLYSSYCYPKLDASITDSLFEMS